MQIDVIKEGDVVIVGVMGDLDADFAPDLRSKFEELVGRGENQYIVDLSEVPLIDSSGIAALVNLFKRVRIGTGDVKLCGITEEIMKIFHLTRLDRVFDIFDNRKEAIASFQPQNED